MQPVSTRESLLSLSGPWAHLAICPQHRFSSFLADLSDENNGIVVSIIRGALCATSAGLFNESASALDFPSYFGHNWDAFNDCINDLEWLPASHYVIGVSQSDLLLIRDSQRLTTLVDILKGAADTWPSYEADRDWTKTWVTMDDGITQWAQRSRASFHVVFQSEEGNVAIVHNRFQAAGLDCASIERPIELPNS